MSVLGDAKWNVAAADGFSPYRKKGEAFYTGYHARRIAHDSSLRTLGASRKLSPLPNLFRGTFEKANKQCVGEEWLQQRIVAFDAGNKQKRKEVLEEFLAYVQNSTAAGLEELFSNCAHLFFVRLTSWFAVTLPMFYELALQVKVFLAFLEYREQFFVRAFFETGLVVTLMQILSVNYDCSDEVRCLVLLTLRKLAANGRHHKELLCGEGLIPKVMDCMSDGLQWETLKYAGRLLSEMFCANPKYQAEVMDSLQGLMEHKFALAQRVSIQVVISLVGGARYEIPKLLQSHERHKALVDLALPMLDSADLRLGAEAYCLLSRLVNTFACDELLHDFARAQVASYGENAEEWLRLELDAEHVFRPGASIPKGTPFGGWWQMSTDRIHKHISDVLVQTNGKMTGDVADTLQTVKHSNAVFAEAFRKESSHVLKWALVMFLTKRSSHLCIELVAKGLTETLLMCLLDLARPVQQAAALSELHRLRLESPVSEKIVSAVLVRPETLGATSLAEFMNVVKPDELERARFRLRSIWNCLHEVTSRHRLVHSADEMNLTQQLLEKEMSASLGIAARAKSFFLTGVQEQEENDMKGENTAESLTKSCGEETVHRSGKDKFDVRRAPVNNVSHGHGGDKTRIEMGPMEEIPFCGSLASLLFDPLELQADEESPLIQEMRTIEAFGTFRGFRKPIDGAYAFPSTRRQPGKQKGSHQSDIGHTRALVLRKVPPPGVELLRPKKRSPLAPERSLSSMSGSTEFTIHCGDLAHLGIDTDAKIARALEAIHQGDQMDGLEKPSLHETSLADTSVGPDWLHEQSHDYLSSGPSQELSTAGPSFMTAGYCGTDSTDTIWQHSCSCSHQHVHNHSLHSLLENDHLGSIEEGPPSVVTQRSPLVAVIEKSKRNSDVDDVEISPAPQKRVLQIASAPHHICLAFDPLEMERERGELADGVSALMHPKTRRLFQDISDAGKFPKKNVIRSRKVQPLQSIQHSSSNSAASTPEESSVLGFENGKLRMPSLQGEFPSYGMALDDDWHAPGSARHPLQDAGERLKAYFPASART